MLNIYFPIIIQQIVALEQQCLLSVLRYGYHWNHLDQLALSVMATYIFV